MLLSTVQIMLLFILEFSWVLCQGLVGDHLLSVVRAREDFLSIPAKQSYHLPNDQSVLFILVLEGILFCSLSQNLIDIYQ